MTLVVVDGYGSSRYIPREFANFGVRCVLVQSAVEVPTFFRGSYVPSRFFASIPYEPDLDRLCDSLRSYKPSAVVAGIESGVYLADRLASALGLPGNSASSSTSRRNKFVMIEAVGCAGLGCAKHKLVDDRTTFTREDADALGWPLVAKPASSAGSDNVFVCTDMSQLQHALSRILSEKGIIEEEVNAQGVVQSYLEGEQFVVNTVSMDGKHQVAEIWQHALAPTPTGGEIVEYKSSVAATEPFVDDLIDYTKNVLDAVGIENGAGHAEVRKTRRGFALIEVGARLMGGPMERRPHIACFGYSHASMLALRYGDPAAFAANQEARYLTHSHLASVNLRATRTGILTDMPALGWLAELESFDSVLGAPQIGQQIVQNANNASYGSAYLLHPDREVLVRDLELVSNWKTAEQVFVVVDA